MDILLIAGLWLDGSAWDDVVPALEELGHRPVPLTLPGQGDGSTTATLADQVEAVVAAVDAAAGPPLVVGHSAACALAWLAADARPDRVAGVALIGGFPTADGEAYADFLDHVDGADALPRLGSLRGAGLRRPRRGGPAQHRGRGDRRARGGHQGHGAARPTSGATTYRCCWSVPSSRPPRPRSGSTRATCPSWPGPSTWSWSISTRVTGRCSPGRSSWPGCWLALRHESLPRRRRGDAPGAGPQARCLIGTQVVAP